LRDFETERFALHWQSTDEPSGLPSARNKLLDLIFADWRRELVLVVFLDDDCEVDTKFVQQVSQAAQSYDAFTFRIKTIGRSGIVNTLDNAIVWHLLAPFIGRAWLRIGFLRGGYFQELSEPRQVHHMPGGCLIYRFDKYHCLRFDERFNEGNAIHEDVDFSQALRMAGAELWYCGWHEIIHRPPATGGVRIEAAAEKFYYYWKHKWFLVKKWRGARYLPLAFLWGFVEAFVVTVMHRRWLFAPLFRSFCDVSHQDARAGKRTRTCSPQSGVDPHSTLGGEVYDANVLRELVKKADVELLLPNDKSCYDAGAGWSITTMPRAQTSFGYYWGLLKNLRYVYRTRPFQVLRVHSPYIMAFPIRVFSALNSKVRTYAHYHHVEESFKLRLITKWFARKWDGISVSSEATKNELCDRFDVDSERMAASPPGLKVDDAVHESNFRKQQGLENQFVLLHVGSLIPRKNVKFLIDVVAASLPSVVLVIIGDGSEREYLEQYAHRRGCASRVRFLGRVANAEKFQWMRAVDVFALASKKEGFGMAVAEAALCGTPAIVSDRGSLPEIVQDGITGAVCPLSVDVWRRVVDAWMDDEELVKKLGDEAKKIARQFTWEEAGRVQYKHIKSIL